MLSKDQSQYEAFRANLDETKFFDGNVDLVKMGNAVALQSFPRSGNVMTRKFLESITGIYTGTDMTSMWTFFETMMGLLGQNIVADDNTVWVTKTHDPKARPDQPAFTANKIISIQRNPIDVIVSFAYLVNLNSHSLEPNEQLNKDLPEEWNAWVSG